MGHAVDNKHGISQAAAADVFNNPNSVAYKIGAAWAKELSADLISAEYLGPAVKRQLSVPLSDNYSSLFPTPNWWW
jgi:hypothetical protein